MAAGMLLIIDVDSQHTAAALKNWISEFFAENYHDAATMRTFCSPAVWTHFLRPDFSETDLQAFLERVCVGACKRR